MILSVKETKKFTNAVERVTVDSNKIHFACYGGYCSLFSTGSEGSVVWYIENSGEFYGSVELDRFVTFFKKLKVDQVKLQFKKTTLVIKGKGVYVSLPIFNGFETFPKISFEEVINEGSELVLNGFKNASKSVGNSSKFGGVLIDSQRVCNFDFDTLSVNYHGNDFSRCVLPLGISLLLKTVKSVDNFFKFSNKFGINLGNNLYVLYPILEDSYPNDYMSALKLEDVEKPLGDNNYYEFNKSEFSNSVDLVFNTVGPSELILRFTQNNTKTWKISSKSYKNVEAENFIKSEIGEERETCFGLNAKKLSSAIKSFGGDSIRFYDFCEFYVVLSGEDQKQLVFLLKSHI